MREGDQSFEALREAIDGYAVERAPELVAEAQAEAASRVRRMLVDAIADSLLEETGARLGGRPIPAPTPQPAPTRQPAPTPTAQPAQGGDGMYVYGVAHRESKLPLGIAGIDPLHKTERIVHGDLAALVSSVPLAEFGEEALLDNLNDVDWLEEKARAHERVLDAALAGTTVVPLRLCTIYAGESQVLATLEDEGATFAEALERLAGHTEWGVKLVVAPDALERAARSEGEPAGAPAPGSPGAAYLADKRRQAEVRERADEIAHAWVERVHDRLLETASDGVINPPQNPELSGYDGEMLLNGVYLVRESLAEGFRRAVDALRTEFEGQGAVIDLSGPWPAYNFVASRSE